VTGVTLGRSSLISLSLGWRYRCLILTSSSAMLVVVVIRLFSAFTSLTIAFSLPKICSNCAVCPLSAHFRS